jgi:hypothetical protein
MPYFVNLFLIRQRTIFIIIALLIYPLHSQELEPRSLTNIPIGTNFLVFGYGYATGNILLDPALPIEDLESRVHTFIGAYVRPINFFGMSGKVDVIVPWAAGDWEGLLEKEHKQVKRDGFGDPRIRLSFNFLGAPAYTGQFDVAKTKKTVAGASLQIITPFGEYFSDKLINLGSNRWTFRTQIGVAHSFGKWIIEGYSGIWIFTPNNDFWGGFKLEQRPLFTLKLHLIYSLPPNGSWITIGAGYGIGGRALIDDIERDTHISTLRLGLVYAIPLTRGHTIKLGLTSGRRFEKGADFDAIVLSYQYFWGNE